MKTPITDEEQRALDRIGAAVYGLSSEQLQGFSASAARNIVTDLGDAIVAEVRREREACAALGCQVANEGQDTPPGSDPGWDVANEIVDRIRARDVGAPRDPVPSLDLVTARARAADAILAVFGADSPAVRSGATKAVDAIFAVFFQSNERYRTRREEPGANIEALWDALCALRLMEQAQGTPKVQEARVQQDALVAVIRECAIAAQLLDEETLVTLDGLVACVRDLHALTLHDGEAWLDPLVTTADWIAARVRAARQAGVVARPEVEILVVAAEQPRGTNNGPWLVRGDGSRRRPGMPRLAGGDHG